MTSSGRATKSARGVAALTALLALAALACRYVPAETAAGAGLRLAAAAFLVAALPGVALVLLLRPSGRQSLLDLLALGLASNLALVQLLTVLAISLHLPTRQVLLAATAASFAALGLTALWPGPGRVTAWGHELALAGLLLVPAFCAYLLGTPYTYTAGEDGTHIAIVRRLALLEAPAIDNIYWAPGIVYTYPFPSTHYLLALVSQAADLDPMFVYRKIRFLWAFEAQLFLYAAARRVFGSEKTALLTAVAGAVFSLSGPFALAHNFRGDAFSWSQLIPLSHASDVAMNVYLPALLLVTFRLLGARRTLDQLKLGVIAAGLVLLLAAVHMREAIQFFVYLAALLAGALLLGQRQVLRRGLLLAGSGLLLTLGYLAWHQRAVGHIDSFVRERRDLLVRVASEMGPADWLFRPFLHPAFGSSLESFFFSFFPFLLLLGPVLLAWRPRRPQAVLVASSVAAYLLIVRFAPLTIPYIYVTYFEILFTPVRNVVFFLYLLAGLAAAALAIRVSRIREPRHRVAAVAAIALVSAAAYRWAGPLLARWPARFLELALFLHLGALWLVRRHPERLARVRAWLRPVPRRDFVVTGGALLTLIAVLTFSLKASPLAVTAAGGGTPREALELPVIEERDVPFPYDPGHPERLGQHPSLRVARIVSTPPPRELIEWASRRLPAGAVLAPNLLNRYSPAPFLPQQIAYWPHIDLSTGSYFRRIFPAYYERLEASLARRKAQPFFNEEDTLDERLEFLHAVGATHVLVDPMYNAELVPLLSSWPGAFRKLYDAGGWAVFEAIARG